MKRGAVAVRPGIAALAVAALITFGAIGCGGSTDERDRIRTWCDEIAQAAAERDLGEIRKRVSDDYRDADGRDKRTLIAMLTLQLRQQSEVFVEHRVRSIDLDGNGSGARVEVLVAAAGRRPAPGADLFAGLDGDVVLVTAELKREGRAWRLIEAAWRRVEPDDLLPG